MTQVGRAQPGQSAAADAGAGAKSINLQSAAASPSATAASQVTGFGEKVALQSAGWRRVAAATGAIHGRRRGCGSDEHQSAIRSRFSADDCCVAGYRRVGESCAQPAGWRRSRAATGAIHGPRRGSRREEHQSAIRSRFSCDDCCVAGYRRLGESRAQPAGWRRSRAATGEIHGPDRKRRSPGHQSTTGAHTARIVSGAPATARSPMPTIREVAGVSPKIATGWPVRAIRTLQPARTTEHGSSPVVQSTNRQSAAPSAELPPAPTASAVAGAALPRASAASEIAGLLQEIALRSPLDADRTLRPGRSTEERAHFGVPSIDPASTEAAAAFPRPSAAPEVSGVSLGVIPGSPIEADRALQPDRSTEPGEISGVPSINPQTAAPAPAMLPVPNALEVAGVPEEVVPTVTGSPVDADRAPQSERSTERGASSEVQSSNPQPPPSVNVPLAAVGPSAADAPPATVPAISVTVSEGITPAVEETQAVAAQNLPDAVYAAATSPVFADSPISQEDGKWVVSQLTADSGDAVDAAPRCRDGEAPCDAAVEPLPAVAAGPIGETDTASAVMEAAPMTARTDSSAESQPAPDAERTAQGIMDWPTPSTSPSTAASTPPSIAATATESDVELEIAEEITLPMAPARTDVISVTAKPVLIPKSPTPAAPRSGLSPGNGPVRPGAGVRQGPGGGKAPVRSGIVPPRPAGFVSPSARQPGPGANPGQKHASVRRVTGAKGTPRFIQATPPRAHPAPASAGLHRAPSAAPRPSRRPTRWPNPRPTPPVADVPTPTEMRHAETGNRRNFRGADVLAETVPQTAVETTSDLEWLKASTRQSPNLPPNPRHQPSPMSRQTLRLPPSRYQILSPSCRRQCRSLRLPSTWRCHLSSRFSRRSASTVQAAARPSNQTTGSPARRLHRRPCHRPHCPHSYPKWSRHRPNRRLNLPRKSDSIRYGPVSTAEPARENRTSTEAMTGGT